MTIKIKFLKIELNLVLGIFLIFLLGIPRFILVLQANELGDYSKIPIIFITMVLLPFIFLNKKGRTEIGIRKSNNFQWIIYSFILGLAYCSILFFITQIIYNHSISNFFVYISNSYKTLPKSNFSGTNKLIYFIIYAVTSMSFSPFGEEFFYRGLVHKAITNNLGEKKATIIDGLAFAFTHLAHFGIIFYFGKWQFLLFPSIIWLAFMFLASLLFNYCKQKTGSIWGAVICHSGFNLAMMYFIFYQIL